MAKRLNICHGVGEVVINKTNVVLPDILEGRNVALRTRELNMFTMSVCPRSGSMVLSTSH